MTKETSRLIGIIYYCDKLKKEIELKDTSKLYFSGGESECELCGSHGSVNVYISCECGKNHDIELTSW